jgi:hypothetical protein
MNAQSFDLMDQCFNGEDKMAVAKVLINLLTGNQMLYFRKIMATLFLGIDSSEGIDSAMESIPRRDRFLLYENF